MLISATSGTVFTMEHTISGAGRFAIVFSSVVLLILAVIHAAITALFLFLMAQPKHQVVVLGDIRMYSEFGYYGAPIFLLICLLSGYAGLAAIFRWRGSQIAPQIAGWATIGLGVYGLWVFLCLITPNVPYPPFTIGMNLPPLIAFALCVIGIFVLWAVHKPTERNP